MGGFHGIAARLGAGALAAAALLALGACSGSHSDPDERAWLRGFADRAVADLGQSEGLRSIADPYVGACRDGLAAVSWQATLDTTLPANVAGPTGISERSKDIEGRLLIDSGLGSDRVGVINVGGSGDAVNTLVFRPSTSSSVLVSVPQAASVLAVGFVSC